MAAHGGAQALRALSRTRETFPLLVFGPPAMVGNLAVHLLLARKFGGETAVQDDGRVAHAVLTGQAAFAAVTAVAGAAFNVGSAYLAALNLGSGLLALFANDLLLATSRPGGSVQRVHVATYFLASVRHTHTAARAPSDIVVRSSHSPSASKDCWAALTSSRRSPAGWVSIRLSTLSSRRPWPF